MISRLITVSILVKHTLGLADISLFLDKDYSCFERVTTWYSCITVSVITVVSYGGKYPSSTWNVFYTDIKHISGILTDLDTLSSES